MLSFFFILFSFCAPQSRHKFAANCLPLCSHYALRDFITLASFASQSRRHFRHILTHSCDHITSQYISITNFFIFNWRLRGDPYSLLYFHIFFLTCTNFNILFFKSITTIHYLRKKGGEITKFLYFS